MRNELEEKQPEDSKMELLMYIETIKDERDQYKELLDQTRKDLEEACQEVEKLRRIINGKKE